MKKRILIIWGLFLILGLVTLVYIRVVQPTETIKSGQGNTVTKTAVILPKPDNQVVYSTNPVQIKGLELFPGAEVSNSSELESTDLYPIRTVLGGEKVELTEYLIHDKTVSGVISTYIRLVRKAGYTLNQPYGGGGIITFNSGKQKYAIQVTQKGNDVLVTYGIKV